MNSNYRRHENSVAMLERITATTGRSRKSVMIHVPRLRARIKEYTSDGQWRSNHHRLPHYLSINQRKELKKRP